MEILVLGGTRLMGIHLVEALLHKGHSVTIATRGITQDEFGDRVKRIIVDRTDPVGLKESLGDQHYDVVCDSLAYCSNDVRILLDVIQCSRYVMISSASVYQLGMDIKEADFDPVTYPLRWLNRTDATYDEIKRQAECALFQSYPKLSKVAIRFPYVIGREDYTKRLYYYVEHIFRGIPMYIDYLDAEISYIMAQEAGSFLAWLAESDYIGSINGCNSGKLTIAEIIKYIEEKTGKKAVLKEDAEAAPYNGSGSFSLNTDLAREMGFNFSPINSRIYELLDYYINLLGAEANDN